MFFLFSFNTLLDDDPAAKELEYAINSRHRWVNPLSANPAKWSNHLNNSLAVAHKLFECVWPFYGVGDWGVKLLLSVEKWLFKFNSKYTKTTSKDFILMSSLQTFAFQLSDIYDEKSAFEKAMINKILINELGVKTSFFQIFQWIILLKILQVFMKINRWNAYSGSCRPSAVREYGFSPARILSILSVNGRPRASKNPYSRIF